MNDTISYNFILANYHSSMAIDNDDGSWGYDSEPSRMRPGRAALP